MESKINDIINERERLKKITSSVNHTTATKTADKNMMNIFSSLDAAANDVDEGFAENGKSNSSNAGSVASAQTGDVEHRSSIAAGSVDDDTFECPLFVYNAESSTTTTTTTASTTRSGAVTPGSENNMSTNGDDDDDENSENINLLQQQPTAIIPNSTTTQDNNNNNKQPEEQQWPKDHPRNPRRDPNLSELCFRFRIPNAAYMGANVLSPPHYLRGLPWKVFVMSKPAEQFRHSRSAWQQQQQPAVVPAEKVPIANIGIFLQCNAQDTSLGWSCHGEAKIRLINEHNEIVHDRAVVHNFYHKENDWGFSSFMDYGKADWLKSVHSRDGALLIQIEATADPPHGTNWNSKRLTGYVGLKNQGATCYMNSLLQALYFTNYLRRAVYLISTELEDPSKSIAFQLQRLFFDLQISSKPASTKRLTQAFGWDSIDSLVQHDVEEFCRMLLDNLEDKLKGTAMEGAINQLFEGRTISYIKCKDISYTSSRVETFMDVALNVKGLANVEESFREYCTTDDLIGDNQYDAGAHGKQDAIKGIKFVQFPPVLHLHLKRFTYDIQTGDFVKINDKFEFPQHLDLSACLDTDLYMTELHQQLQQQQIDADLLAATQQQPLSSSAADAAAAASINNNYTGTISELIAHQPPPLYSLHAVFVHSGDHHGGHYVCYINPNCDGHSWYKFDDDVVSKCQTRQAIEGNYGGTNDTSSRSCSNAYMLVYVRDFDRDRVLCPVQRNDLNPMFFIRLNRQAMLDARLEQREPVPNEPQVTFKILLDSDLRPAGVHPGMFDLALLQPSLSMRISANDTWRDAHLKLAKVLSVSPLTIRMWPLIRDTEGGGGGGGGGGMGNAAGYSNAPKFRLQFISGYVVPPSGDDAAANESSIQNYPHAPSIPTGQLLAEDSGAVLHMERKLTHELQITKPPRTGGQHHQQQQQQQSVVFVVSSNDEYTIWLHQSPDGVTPLPLTTHMTHVLMFVKLYDPKYSLLHLERAVFVPYVENEFRITIDDLYKQLARLLGINRSPVDENVLFTWFDGRIKELHGIRLPAYLGNSFWREILNRGRQHKDTPETAPYKIYTHYLQSDGDAVIVQRGIRQEDLDRAKQTYRHALAPSYTYEQTNMIRLVLQEREGGSTQSSTLAATVSATSSNTSLTSSSATHTTTTNNNTTTNSMQRMSPPVAGAGAVVAPRTHWPELIFEVSQLMALSDLQKMVAERLGIDDARKVMFSKLTSSAQNQQASGGGNKMQGGSMSAFGSSNNNTSSATSLRDSQPITQLGKLALSDVFGSVPLFHSPVHARRRKLLLYTVLPMPIEDFDSKREVDIYYLPDVRDAVDNGGPGGVERTLFVNQQARVSELLTLVRQQYAVPLHVGLRMVEVCNNSIRQPPLRDNLDISASMFENSSKNKQFRVEPVPEDQRLLTASTTYAIMPSSSSSSSTTAFAAPTGGQRASTPLIASKAEILLPVGHFQKETFATFGTPFLMRLVEGDTYGTLRERIRGMLNLTEKDMEKWKVCIVNNAKREHEEEESERVIPVVEYCKLRIANQAPWPQVWVGLDHINNQGLRSGVSLPGVAGGQMKKVRAAAEKTLKIHN